MKTILGLIAGLLIAGTVMADCRNVNVVRVVRNIPVRVERVQVENAVRVVEVDQDEIVIVEREVFVPIVEVERRIVRQEVVRKVVIENGRRVVRLVRVR